MLSAMSSTENQPIPQKRPIDQVTPEFPGLPMTSLEATKEFAAKSQAALSSVPTISTSLASIFLPLISPHKLQQRFNVKEKSVFVVCRKSYFVLKGLVETFNIEDYSGIYVRGPVGVGKSYLLYLLAAEYRLDRDNYRVTYINDCAAWKVDMFGYILRELVMTFFNDDIESKSIVEWCQAILESDKEVKLTQKLMNSLVNYTREKNLQWIIICDQHNAFYARKVVVDDFPFSIISNLSKRGISNIKVLVSASANNEGTLVTRLTFLGYPTEMKGWYTHDISSNRFDAWPSRWPIRWRPRATTAPTCLSWPSAWRRTPISFTPAPPACTPATRWHPGPPWRRT